MFFGSWSEKKGVFTTFRGGRGGGVRIEVVKIHNFFFLNESFPKSFELIKVPEVWAHRPPPPTKKLMSIRVNGLIGIRAFIY